MITIGHSSWKGGTGKTTLAVAAITTLAKMGKKVLAIDLDSNLSLTRCFEAIGNAETSVDLLNGSIIEPVKVSGNIDIIPSDLRISRMSNISDRTLKVSMKKLNLSGYDYVYIDPPGTMNALTRNAICASDKVVIPSMPSEIDFEATGLVFEEMEMMGVEADISVILNGFDTKRNLNYITNKFVEEYKDFYYHPPIPAMKSLKNLTANVSGYNLTGRAKELIDRFVEGVIL